jgi:putative ABC transport system permease protein
MREVITQVLQNLRANKLRSFLTMFAILWGVISVVVLSATGEGFQRGNQHVLEELGRNVGIIWGGRTSLQAGGERAGRPILLTVDDARALARESNMIAVVSPEIQRGAISVKSAYNAAALMVHGIEPQYQQIRTIDIERGRSFRFTDEDGAPRVAIIGADAGAANAPTIAVHGLAGLWVRLPVPSAPIRSRDVATDANGFEVDERLITVMATSISSPNGSPPSCMAVT